MLIYILFFAKNSLGRVGMKRVLLLVLCLSQSLFGMWHGLKQWFTQETKQEQLLCSEFGLKKSNQSFAFNELPPELQLMIINQLAQAESIEKSVVNLRSLSSVNKQWHAYLTTELISKLVAQKFNISEVLAFWYLKTSLSRSIPEKQITQLIAENLPEFNRVYQQAVYLDFNTRSALSKKIVNQLRLNRYKTKKQWVFEDGSYLSLNAMPDVSLYKYTVDRKGDQLFGGINYVITPDAVIPELTNGEQGTVMLRNVLGLVSKPTGFFSQLGSVSSGANPLGFNYISTDITVQSTGKIIVLGVLDNQFVMVRLYENGNLDENFGVNGLVLTRINLKKEYFKNAQKVDLLDSIALLPVYVTTNPATGEILLTIGNTYKRYSAEGHNIE